jgi:hypothetical protein
MSGAETGGVDEWEIAAGTNVDEAHRSGNRCFKIGAYNQQMRKDLGTTYSELYGGFAFYWTTTWGYNSIQLAMWLNGSGTVNMSLGVWPMTGEMIYRGGNNSAAAMARGGFLKPETWHYLEWYIKFHSSAGIVRLKIDGVQVIEATGKNTAVSGSALCRYVRFGGSGTTNNEGMTGYLDDVVIDSAVYPGRVGLYPLLPADAGNYAQLTPSTAPNWECVNEVPASDVDYVSSDVLDTIDTYAMSSVVPTAGTVGTVKWYARAKTSATTANLARILRRSATDSQGSDIALTTSYVLLNEMLATDPIAVGAWTIANLNASEFGIVVR